MDYVPNHTSDMHPWFAKASNSSDPEFDKYKDFFVWTDRGRDADGNPVIPNNWERPLKPNVLYTDYSPLIAIPVKYCINVVIFTPYLLHDSFHQRPDSLLVVRFLALIIINNECS